MNPICIAFIGAGKSGEGLVSNISYTYYSDSDETVIDKKDVFQAATAHVYDYAKKEIFGDDWSWVCVNVTVFEGDH